MEPVVAGMAVAEVAEVPSLSHHKEEMPEIQEVLEQVEKEEPPIHLVNVHITVLVEDQEAEALVMCIHQVLLLIIHQDAS